MTNLTPIESTGIGRVTAPKAKAEVVDTKEASKARRGDDRVEVSDAARFLSKMNAMPDIRTELVERVRGEIANGTYDTDEKFDLALDGLADDLMGEAF